MESIVAARGKHYCGIFSSALRIGHPGWGKHKDLTSDLVLPNAVASLMFSGGFPFRSDWRRVRLLSAQLLSWLFPKCTMRRTRLFTRRSPKIRNGSVSELVHFWRKAKRGRRLSLEFSISNIGGHTNEYDVLAVGRTARALSLVTARKRKCAMGTRKLTKFTSIAVP